MATMKSRMAGFHRRVNYAHAAFLRKEDSREFDNCFEMHDGALVVTALMRRAEHDPDLKAAILRDFPCASGWEGLTWFKTAQNHAMIKTENLAKMAAQVQIEAEWVWVNIRFPQLNKAQKYKVDTFVVTRREGGNVREERLLAENARDAVQSVRSWSARTVEGVPYLSLLAEITVRDPDGQIHSI